jgi:hypothetical protein
VSEERPVRAQRNRLQVGICDSNERYDRIALNREDNRAFLSCADVYVGLGGQRFEIPGLVLLSQPSERLLERVGALFLDTVSTKVDAKPAPGGPVVVEDVRRGEANQFSASAGS